MQSGTHRAIRAAVRAVLLSVLLVGPLAGCFAASSDSGSTRPSAMPMLSELPTDAEKRDAILNQSGERARPENRKSLTKKERKAETTAAYAAAILGQAFSKTQNVTLGVATDVDENKLFETPHPQPAKQGSGAGSAAATDDTKATDLVPWIKIDPKAKSADDAKAKPAGDAKAKPAVDQKSKPADSDSVR